MPLEELAEEKRRLEEAGTVCQENLALIFINAINR